MAETPRERRNRLRRELYAINRERKRERQGIYQAFPQLTSAEEATPAGAFRPGDPARQDWEPDRWIYSGGKLSENLSAGIASHIDGNVVRVAFIIDAPEMMAQGPWESGSRLGGSRFAFGANFGADSLRRELDSGKSVAQILEDREGWARGTIHNVEEVNIAEHTY